MKSQMNFLCMLRLSFPMMVRVFPVPVGPTQRTFFSFRRIIPISSEFLIVSIVGTSISMKKIMRCVMDKIREE